MPTLLGGSKASPLWRWNQEVGFMASAEVMNSNQHCVFGGHISARPHNRATLQPDPAPDKLAYLI